VRCNDVFIACFAGAALACGSDGDRGYLRFTVDEQPYEVSQVEFVVMPLNEDLHFIGLGPDPTQVGIQDTPNAAVQWVMRFGAVEELAGTTFDLSEEQLDAAVMIMLTEDLSLTQDLDSRFTVAISRVAGEVVEGSFEGAGFVEVSMTRDVTRSVSFSGDFRARLRTGRE
jgi:hypothetical protein